VGAIGCIGLASGNLIIVSLASLLIGVAYGMTNPAASQLLNRVTPENRRGIVFSVKQSGVPLGGAVAGLSLPALTVLLGWQGAILCIAGIALIVAVCMVPIRKHLDYDRDVSVKISGNLTNGPAMVWNLPRLRALSLMGFCFSAVQLSLMSFMVILLVEDALWGIIAAGVVASFVQILGAIARVSWGMLADRTGCGMPVLAIIGTITCCACIGVSGLTPGWPDWLIILTLSIFGVAAIGWNGVFIAEVVRSAPHGKVGEATGGALTFTFAGVVLGPSLYAAVHSFFPSYSTTFLALMVLPAVGVALLLKEMTRD
jgi:MFS family permease